MVNFVISDWYSAGSGPVPIIASLVSGGVKSTVNPSEAASICRPAKFIALTMTMYRTPLSRSNPVRK